MPSIELLAASAVLAGAALYFAYSATNWRALARARGDELIKLTVQYGARGNRIRLLEAQVAATDLQRANALAKAVAANRARAEAKRASATK